MHCPPLTGWHMPRCACCCLRSPCSQASQDDRSEDVGPGLDDYEPVPDDNPEARGPAGSQGFSDDGVTEQGGADEEEEGEDLFGDAYLRCALRCAARHART